MYSRKMKFVLLLFAISAFGRQDRSIINTAGNYDYIVSIPDVHGDLEILIRSLWIAKSEIESQQSKPVEKFSEFYDKVKDQMKINDAIGETRKSLSRPKRVLLVQTGDIIDRGPASKSCYKALWAAEHVLGWDLVNLFGNHEVLTMAGQGDHYAHPDDVSEFGSLSARRDEFSPGGKIWNKLVSEFQFMLKVDIPGLSPTSAESILFVHAGISPRYVEAISKKLASNGGDIVTRLNSFLLKEVMRNPNSDYLVSANSPIWTRDLASAPEKKVCSKLLPSVLELMNVTRVVLGHTPQQKLVTGNRCDGQLLLADVAMSRWMGSGQNGNPASVLFVLGNDGRQLTRVVNLYWKGTVTGDDGQIVDHLLFEKNATNDKVELDNPEL
jgi:hypothetical protein